MALGGLLGSAGVSQLKQSLPGIKSDPFGSFSHFMGATNANIFDPLNIFGQSGGNPIQNFLNPGGATLIPGMTPSNNPLPGGAPGSISGAGGGSVMPAGTPMQSGITPEQQAMLNQAYMSYMSQLNPGMASGMGAGPLAPPPTPLPTPSLRRGGGPDMSALAALGRFGGGDGGYGRRVIPGGPMTQPR